MIIVILLENTVGVMIAYNNSGFIKSNYRKFNIKFNKEKNKNKVDDYYMMKEMIIRRFSNVRFKEDIDLPDLILIDGVKVNTILQNK